MPHDPVVEVSDLSVRFVNRDLDLQVVDGVSFSLAAGEVLCLLGESGSGKSVTMRALLRLLPDYARIGGKIRLAGKDVTTMTDRQLEAVRGPVGAMIFQEPMTALDPVFTIGTQISETIVSHEGVSYREARKRSLELLEMVQIPSAERRLDSYPHELSGGLRPRAMIALALSCRPSLLLADEPTTALDATVQIQILLLIRSLQRELGMATIFVTHDIGVACEVADRVSVMYAGRFVETGPVADVTGHTATSVFNATGHPAISLCSGFDAAGLPLSAQLAGNWFDEATLLRITHAYEQATPWRAARPEIPAQGAMS